jgi:putative ATPase
LLVELCANPDSPIPREINNMGSWCRVLIDEETVIWLAEMCDGDARVALNSLQLALQARDQDSGVILISLDDIKDGVKVM